MSATLSITVTPSIESQTAALQKWSSLLGDFTGYFRRLQRLVELGIVKDFETSGDWSGAVWPPLSEAYARFKAREFPGRPILVRTGALRNSLRSGGAGNIRSVGAQLVDFGTRIPYAEDVAAEGRPPVRVPRDWDAVMLELYGSFVILKMRQAGVPLEFVSGSALARLAFNGADEAQLARAAARRVRL